MANNPGERARDAYEKAKSAAAPKIAKAQAEAKPRAEKAAKQAGHLFGKLKDRAQETAKGFSDGYKGKDEPPAGGQGPKPN